MDERVFSTDELAGYDGKEGRPAYVAWRGKVYDVSGSPEWEEGEHWEEHGAGAELTEELENFSPHGPEALDGFTQVGTLSE
jgi:predicted heme/steroid binding protein